MVVGRRLRALAAVGGLALTFAGGAVAADGGWLRQSGILVPGDLVNTDCRTGVCKHNENTDLTHWRGATWLVHRTADSQILGPNSSLRVYRSRDEGRTFKLQAIIPAPATATSRTGASSERPARLVTTSAVSSRTGA